MTDQYIEEKLKSKGLIISNYRGTLFRVVFILISLVVFWFVISFIAVLLLSILFGLNMSLSILGYMFLFIMLIRIFYPKFIFKN